MAAVVLREQTLEVSADLVRDSPGLSLDIGGSATKVVFRHKDDWEELQNTKDAKTGKLRLLSCARTELHAAIDKVKAEGYITPGKDGKPTEIFTCGIGCHQFGARINRELNVKSINVLEMDCFFKGFLYMANHYSFKTLVAPPCQKVLDEVAEDLKKQLAMADKWKSATAMDLGDLDKLLEENMTDKVDPYDSELPMTEMLGDSMYPCIVAMLGSAYGFMKVEKDGSYTFPDGSIRGGRMLLGLGSLLCGAQSYSEIIDLAEKGDQFKASTSNLQFQKESSETEEPGESETNVYGDLMESMYVREQPLFLFGNAVGKSIDDFKREDLASTLVNTMVFDTVQCVINAADKCKAKRVFIAGGFASRLFVKELFTREWFQRQTMLKMTNKEAGDIELHFMEQGAHVGALGALINNVEKFIGTDGNVTSASTVDDIGSEVGTSQSTEHANSSAEAADNQAGSSQAEVNQAALSEKTETQVESSEAEENQAGTPKAEENQAITPVAKENQSGLYETAEKQAADVIPEPTEVKVVLEGVEKNIIKMHL